MAEGIPGRKGDADISEQNMQFKVVDQYPDCPVSERETRKMEIEKQLFMVFQKYGGSICVQEVRHV